MDAGYKRVRVIEDINLQVNKGEIVSIIGANGAGKTTIFRTISGVLSPSAGSIRLNGKDISKVQPHMVVRLGIGQVPEGRQVIPSLSVYDHLVMAGHYSKKYKNESEIKEKLQEMYEIFPVLEERKTQLAGSLSGGQQQMMVVARALMMKPDILLLDEPSLGLAPIIVSNIFEILKKINKEGITILLIEQNAFAALKISHRAYVMENGKIVLEGSAEELANDSSIEKYYLG